MHSIHDLVEVLLCIRGSCTHSNATELVLAIFSSLLQHFFISRKSRDLARCDAYDALIYQLMNQNSIRQFNPLNW